MSKLAYMIYNYNAIHYAITWLRSSTNSDHMMIHHNALAFTAVNKCNWYYLKLTTGGMTKICDHYMSISFVSESFICCHNGKVKLTTLSTYPDVLQQLITGQLAQALNFRIICINATGHVSLYLWESIGHWTPCLYITYVVRLFIVVAPLYNHQMEIYLFTLQNKPLQNISFMSANCDSLTHLYTFSMRRYGLAL